MNDASNKKPALVIATLSAFLAPLMISSVTIALPTIGKEFSMDAILLSWVATSYSLASAMFLVPFGKASDIYGRKKIFTFGMVIYTISSLLLSISTSPAQLISGRILQGIGAAMIFGTGVAILTSVFPPGERGRAIGMNVATVYIGLSVGPFFGGILTTYLGWRSIFLATIPLSLLILFVALRLKGEWAEAKGEKMDYAGSLIYCLTLIAIMYGFSQLPTLRGAGLIVVGILGLLTFVKCEMNVKNPVLDMNLFSHNRVFAFSNLAALVSYSSTFAIAFLLSLYLQYIKGLSPQNAGLILVVQPLVQAIFSPFAGRLSDRIEPGTVASVGMGITVIGLFLFIFLNEKTTLWFVIVNLSLLGFGFALFSSPNMNAIMSSAERRFYGVASGTLATMRMTGQMFSMGISMLLFAIYLGGVQITAPYYPLFLKSTRAAFTVFASLCFLGIFASLARGKMR